MEAIGFVSCFTAHLLYVNYKNHATSLLLMCPLLKCLVYNPYEMFIKSSFFPMFMGFRIVLRTQVIIFYPDFTSLSKMLPYLSKYESNFYSNLNSVLPHAPSAPNLGASWEKGSEIH